jgi:hypothetical protein
MASWIKSAGSSLVLLIKEIGFSIYPQKQEKDLTVPQANLNLGKEILR